MKINCVESMFTSNCYIVNKDDKWIVIDPCVSVAEIKKYTDKIDCVILTHSHMDHIFYLQEIQNYFDCVIYASKEAKEIIIDNDKNFGYDMGIDKEIRPDFNNFIEVKDNDIILDDIEIIATPGHSLDSICIKIGDVLFTGDTLFDRSIGRWDLYGGDYNILENSLKKLLKYKNLEFYPGHGDKSNISMQLITNSYYREAVMNK